MTTAESTAFFTRSWPLYDLITERNYMHHREIHAEIGKHLRLRRARGPYRMLDLGCGNARFLAPCLMESPPARYEGVDLSEAALEVASGNLAALPCPVMLRNGDLLEAVESAKSTWDVVFTGFAVHHLTTDEKARLFHAVGRCLSADGWFLFVDVVREENQSREEYLSDYLRLMRGHWTQIPADQLEDACAHVAAHDYPESLSTLRRMAGAAGLPGSVVISQYGQHYSIFFSRRKEDAVKAKESPPGKEH